MTSAAHRAAVEICASGTFSGRSLGPADVERVRQCIERHLAAARLAAVDLSCHLCGEEIGEDSVREDDRAMCVRCWIALDTARRDRNGRVLVLRCVPILLGLPSCGRVHGIVLDAHRGGGPIVQETGRVCPDCRPANEQALRELEAGELLEEGNR